MLRDGDKLNILGGRTAPRAVFTDRRSQHPGLSTLPMLPQQRSTERAAEMRAHYLARQHQRAESAQRQYGQAHYRFLA